MERINILTERIIGCAVEVDRVRGPGLLEALYERAMHVELERAGIPFEIQAHRPVLYKGQQIGIQRIDLIVEDVVIVELKSVERLDPVFEAQLLSYMRLCEKQVGLLINFNIHLLKYGIKRLIL